MREALADVAGKGIWSQEQRRALKAAFQALVDAFDSVLLLKGKRVLVENIIVAPAVAMDLTIDCPFKPKTVAILGALTKVSGEPATLMTPSIVWTWSSTPTSGAVRLRDVLGNIPDGTYTFDIFMEKS